MFSIANRKKDALLPNSVLVALVFQLYLKTRIGIETLIVVVIPFYNS